MLRGKSDKNILPVVSCSALMVGLIAAAGAFAPRCDARKKAGTTPPHERHPWRAASYALLTMLLVELLRTCGQVRHASSGTPRISSLPLTHEALMTPPGRMSRETGMDSLTPAGCAHGAVYDAAYCVLDAGYRRGALVLGVLRVLARMRG